MVRFPIYFDFYVLKKFWQSHITVALKDKNKEKANEIQVALMVDHPKVCSEFISAFRQLINAEESNQWKHQVFKHNGYVFQLKLFLRFLLLQIDAFTNFDVNNIIFLSENFY